MAPLRTELGFLASGYLVGILAATIWWVFVWFCPVSVLGAWAGVAEIFWPLLDMLVRAGVIAVVPLVHGALRVWRSPPRGGVQFVSSVLVVSLCAAPLAGFAYAVDWRDPGSLSFGAALLLGTSCVTHIVVGALRWLPRS